VKQVKLPRSVAKAIDSYESRMAEDALDDIARKQVQARKAGLKYTDPNAMGGFKRDTWGEKGFEHKENKLPNNAGSESYKEMPEDLLKFLNDAGPLEKKVSKSMTSPKVFESLLEEEEEERQRKEAKNMRTRRRMPMIENEMNNDGGGGDDEMDNERMTTRTTSFSTAAPEVDDKDLKLDEIELFQLLQTSPEAYLKQKGLDIEAPNVLEDQKQEELNLLENVCKYNGIPILMQDVDKSMVGAWNYRVEDLKQQKISIAKSNAKLVLEGEVKKRLK